MSAATRGRWPNVRVWAVNMIVGAGVVLVFVSVAAAFVAVLSLRQGAIG